MENEEKIARKPIRRSCFLWIGFLSCVFGGSLGWLSTMLYTFGDMVVYPHLSVPLTAIGLIAGVFWGSAAGFSYPVVLAWLSRRVHDQGRRPYLRGLLSGILMGMICSTLVHVSIIAFARYGGFLNAALVGLPFGAITGGILGLICARLL